jgi:3-oxoacyl-[acyl-carrier-protein] synthase II
VRAVAPVRRPATTTLGISGWSAVSSAGTTVDDFTAAVLAGPTGPAHVAGLFAERLPRDEAYALVGFAVQDHGGRRRTAVADRCTALALLACGQALADSDLTVDDRNRGRVGVVLGTTLGSLKSTADYSRGTLAGGRPGRVDPLLFPATVLSRAAGRVATRFRLTGVTATVAGAQLAGLSALRYARNQIRRGYADALLVGGVEELSPHTAWVAEHAFAGEEHRVPVGEGAGVVVVEDAAEMRAAGRRPQAEVLAVEVGQYGPPGGEPDPAAGLARCITDALAAAGVPPAEVWAAATGECGVRRLDLVEQQAVGQVVAGARCIRVKETVGDAPAAAASLQLAALLAHHRTDPALDGRVSLVTACSPDGAVGVAVVRGWYPHPSP